MSSGDGSNVVLLSNQDKSVRSKQERVFVVVRLGIPSAGEGLGGYFCVGGGAGGDGAGAIGMETASDRSGWMA